MKVLFKNKICKNKFIGASKSFMEKIKDMKKFKITYLLGNDIRVAFVYGNTSNDVLIKFMMENPSVMDVTKIEEVKE